MTRQMLEGATIPRVWTEVSVQAPAAPPAATMRRSFPRGISGTLWGLVSVADMRLNFGPLPLLGFGEPIQEGSSFAWPITGGLLAKEPGGCFRLSWQSGVLAGAVEDYAPSLPLSIYRLLQLPLHRAVTRLFLLQLRGRMPVGLPASPGPRLLAASLESLVVLAAGRHLVRRGWPLTGLLALSGYHVLGWWLAGTTPVGKLLGLRLIAVDGSRVSLTQALIRLVAAPFCLRGLRARHDQAAATEVVEA